MKRRRSSEKKRPVRGVRKLLVNRRFRREAKPFYEEREALDRELGNDPKLTKTVEHVSRIKKLEDEWRDIMHRKNPHQTTGVSNARKKLDKSQDKYDEFRRGLKRRGMSLEESNELHQRAEQHLAKRQNIESRLEGLRKKHSLK